MASKPLNVILAAQVPEGCHCKWTPRYQNTGGDVRVEWLLIGLSSICRVHSWVPDQDYPLR